MVAWLERIGVRRLVAQADSIVRPLGDVAPEDRIGRLIWQTLRARGPIRLSEVIERVAEQLVEEDQHAGAWAVDVGFLGPALYWSDVERSLRTLVDRSVVIERVCR